RRGAGHGCRVGGVYVAAANARAEDARGGAGGRPCAAVAAGSGDPGRRGPRRGGHHHGRRRPWGRPRARGCPRHRLRGRDRDGRLLEQSRPLHRRRLPRSEHRPLGVTRRRTAGHAHVVRRRPRRRHRVRPPQHTRAPAPHRKRRGADIVKLFTGSWATPRSIVVMPVDVVRAAVEVGHRRGKLVFAHPSNSPGARAAIEGGVDVLAHTFPASLDGSPWDRALPAMMKERGTALIPTLKLWPYELTRGGLPPDLIELVLGNGVAQTRAFAELGGQLLFGTDVGYMT